VSLATAAAGIAIDPMTQVGPEALDLASGFTAESFDVLGGQISPIVGLVLVDVVQPEKGRNPSQDATLWESSRITPRMPLNARHTIIDGTVESGAGQGGRE
jgi:hypothetical protein